MIEKIVSKIRKKNVEWEVFSIKTIKNSFNFLNCELEKSKFEIEEKAAVRVYFDGKLGFSVCNNKNQIEKAIKMAIKNAKIKGKIGFDFSFSEKNVDRFERVYEFDEKLINECCNILKNTKEKFRRAFSSITYLLTTTRIINSNGVDCLEKKSTFMFDSSITLKKGRKYSNAFSHFFHFKPQAIFKEKINEAIKYANDILNARKENEKIKEIVLHPFQLASLASFTLIPSLFASNVQEGFSCFKDGKELSNYFSLCEKPLSNNFFFVRFDEEGNKFKKKVLIKNGKIKNFLYDRYHASREEKKDVSNCFRDKHLKPSIDFTVLRYKFSNKIKEKDLISNVRNGALILFSLGTFLSHQVTGDFSVKVFLGYRIKNGEIKYPIKANTITGNMYEILSSEFLVSKELMKVGSLGEESFFGSNEQHLPYLFTQKISFI